MDQSTNLADYIGVIRKQARRYVWACKNGMDFEDLVQVGLLHCATHACRYDPAKGSFGAFVKTIVQRELYDYANMRSGVVTKPRPDSDLTEATREKSRTMFSKRLVSEHCDVFELNLSLLPGYDAPTYGQPEDVTDNVRSRWVKQAVTKLPEKYREALRAVHHTDKKAIATRDGVSRQAVLNRRNTAVEILQRMAAQENIK